MSLTAPGHRTITSLADPPWRRHNRSGRRACSWTPKRAVAAWGEEAPASRRLDAAASAAPSTNGGEVRAAPSRRSPSRASVHAASASAMRVGLGGEFVQGKGRGEKGRIRRRSTDQPPGSFARASERGLGFGSPSAPSATTACTPRGSGGSAPSHPLPPSGKRSPQATNHSASASGRVRRPQEGVAEERPALGIDRRRWSGPRRPHRARSSGATASSIAPKGRRDAGLRRRGSARPRRGRA